MENPPVSLRLMLRYGDLDPLGHVNNAVYLEYFEAARIAYWHALADLTGATELVDGDIPDARYVLAETTVRYKAPVLFSDTLFGATRVATIGERSYSMEFELRTGESYESGTIVAEGSAAHVFYDPKEKRVVARPEWFLPNVAKLEGREEESFDKSPLTRRPQREET